MTRFDGIKRLVSEYRSHIERDRAALRRMAEALS